MGLFDKLAGILKAADAVSDKVENVVESVTENVEKMVTNDLDIAATSHIIEDVAYGDGDSKYKITFSVNDSFKEAKSHAGEVEMLSTYAPQEEYGSEGDVPYIAIQCDDDVYCAVEEFKETGTFVGAMELTKLSGKFLFKAKRDYYGNIMYFYGYDQCDGYMENYGLCMVYPKSYAGTADEQRIMRVLDEAAESYSEERIV